MSSRPEAPGGPPEAEPEAQPRAAAIAVTTTAAAPGGDSEDDEYAPEPLTAGRAVLQFVLIPSVIVLVGVAVFVLFGWLAYEKHDVDDYVRELRSGSSQKRWQAAFELSKLVRSEGEKLRGTATVDDLRQAYRDAKGDDARIRKYLSLVLGAIGDRRVRPDLETGLADPDPDTQLYALWGLARLGDPLSAPAVVEKLRSPDEGVRKMAAYALGRLAEPSAIEPLRVTLSDRAADVRWNAALALAELGDSSAVPALTAMVDAAALTQLPGVAPHRVQAVRVNAVAALGKLRDPASRPLLERTARSEPDLRVRQAAIAALQAWPQAPPSS